MRRTYLISAVAGGLIALVALIYLLWPKVVIPRQEKAVPPVLQPVVAPTQTPIPDCAPKKYTVEPGDSLWKIAKKEWGGRPYFWPVLAEVNNLHNPNLILIDQVLTIPCLCDLPPRGTKLVAQKRKARKAVTASNSKPKRPAVSTRAVAPQAVLSGSASVAVKPASSKPSAMPRSLLKATGPPALSKAAAEAVPQNSKQKEDH